MIGIGWYNNYSQFGIQWKTFDNPNGTASGLHLGTVIGASNAGSYFTHLSFLTFNTGNNTFTVSSNTANRWALTTPATTTATWSLNGTANVAHRIECVTDIVGVKYR